MLIKSYALDVYLRSCDVASTAGPCLPVAIRGRIVAVVLLGATTGLSAATPDSAAPIRDLYRGYVEAGLLGGKHKAWTPPKVSMTLPSMRTEVRYRVPNSIAFTFPLKWLGASDAIPIMEAVSSDLVRVCGASGGELKFEPKQDLHDPKSDREIKLLQGKRLYGRFSCGSEAAPFEVDVQPGNVVNESNLPPEVSWTLVLATATPDLMLKLREQQRQDAETVETFRRALKPGTPVAVSGAEVPVQQLSPEFKKYESHLRGRKYYVCGLAIDVKDALVQVQVNSGLIYVQPSALRPVKDQLNPSHSLPLESWESWCVKG